VLAMVVKCAGVVMVKVGVRGLELEGGKVVFQMLGGRIGVVGFCLCRWQKACV